MTNVLHQFTLLLTSKTVKVKLILMPNLLFGQLHHGQFHQMWQLQFIQS
ncbi:Uncharacterised protein [Mycobacteroides abscessus subsp. massiliense]|nr:Uncharacterised protein [Mycobacteroides abscessus subsp. massiliense]